MNRIILILVALASSCTGTNTGNPGGLTPISAPANTAAAGLIVSVCTKIAACYSGASADTCESQVLTVNGYPSQLGTTGLSYSTMSALESAEVNSTVLVNQTNLNICETTIQGMSCSDALMIQAYSTTSPTDYSSTNFLFQISSGCQHVY